MDLNIHNYKENMEQTHQQESPYLIQCSLPKKCIINAETIKFQKHQPNCSYKALSMKSL